MTDQQRRFHPAPKPKRIEDREVLDYVVHKRDGMCMIGLARPGKYGLCSAGQDPHHLEQRGSGGDDDPKNLITLCRNHHNMAHAKRIPKEELREILTERYGYIYD
jgi:hypothetical protein